MSDIERRQTQLKAIAIARNILNEFARARTLCGSDLRKRLGLAYATSHRYLGALVTAGFLERHEDKRDGKIFYSLGPFARLIGSRAISNTSVTQEAGPIMVRLRDELDQTVLLAIWTEHGAVIIDWLESSQPVIVNVRIGSILPLSRSSTGLLFAAFLPRSRYSQLLDEEVAGSDVAFARDEYNLCLEAIRQRGFSRVSGDLVSGIGAFSAPIFSRSGELVASLTTLGLSPGFDISWESREASATVSAANELSTRLGFNC